MSTLTEDNKNEKGKKMKIIGLILIAFGLVDLIGSYASFDLWGGFLGVELPDIVWQYSSFVEIGLGYFLFNIGKRGGQEEAAPEAGES